MFLLKKMLLAAAILSALLAMFLIVEVGWKWKSALLAGAIWGSIGGIILVLFVALSSIIINWFYTRK